MWTTVVFVQVRSLLSGGARESRDNVSGLPIGLNKGIMGWRSTNQGASKIQWDFLFKDYGQVKLREHMTIARAISLVDICQPPVCTVINGRLPS